MNLHEYQAKELMRRHGVAVPAGEPATSLDEAKAAISSALVLAERTPGRQQVATYFVEEVRQHLEAEYGARALYEDGLEVHTTLNATMQVAANVAVERQLRILDKRHGYRAPTENGGGEPDGTHRQ